MTEICNDGTIVVHSEHFTDSERTLAQELIENVLTAGVFQHPDSAECRDYIFNAFNKNNVHDSWERIRVNNVNISDTELMDQIQEFLTDCYMSKHEDIDACDVSVVWDMPEDYDWNDLFGIQVVSFSK